MNKPSAWKVHPAPEEAGRDALTFSKSGVELPGAEIPIQVVKKQCAPIPIKAKAANRDKMTELIMRQAFTLFDADGDGFMSISELTNLASGLGKRMDEKQLNAFMTTAIEKEREALAEAHAEALNAQRLKKASSFYNFVRPLHSSVSWQNLKSAAASKSDGGEQNNAFDSSSSASRVRMEPQEIILPEVSTSVTFGQFRGVIASFRYVDAITKDNASIEQEERPFVSGLAL